MAETTKLRRTGITAVTAAVLSALSFGAGAAALNPHVDADIAKHRYSTGQQAEATANDVTSNRLESPRFWPNEAPVERAPADMAGAPAGGASGFDTGETTSGA